MVKNTIGNTLTEGIAMLKGTQSAGEDARVIFSHVLGCDKLYLTVHCRDEISEKTKNVFFGLLKRRLSGEPVSYITGKKEFMSLDFFVDKNVLIPRPDTEILAQRVISEFKGKKVHITDMCTGSGAIAVSLAKYIDSSDITGLDISGEAVKIAKKNADLNGVSKKCKFEVFDVLKPYPIKSDAIVSNPPYIPSTVIDTLDIDVKDFEPKIALDGGDDGLIFYRKIIKNAPLSLKKGGFIAFEVGISQADAVKDLLGKDFENIEIIRDLAGINRVVCGYLKSKKGE